MVGTDDIVFTATVSASKRSFWAFVRNFWDTVPGAAPLVANWHMEKLCEELQTVALRVFDNEPKLYDLVCNISPGTSKSTIFSVLFPAWVWTRMPTARFITASHTSPLVLDLATKSRAVIESDLYQRCFPYVRMAKDQDAKAHYRNTAGGDRFCCTAGGKTPTGQHAHFVISDDLLDPQGAMSDATLEEAGRFIPDTLSTRAVNKEVTVFMLVMQRLHPRDPTGVLLENAKKDGTTPIRHICLPAEEADNISPPEWRQYYVNGLMDPNRLSHRALATYKANPFTYAGQFSQCLVGDTLVRTIRGDVPIRDVVAGDFVLTREGFKRVEWSGKTKETSSLCSVTFSDGSEVTGTSDHPVWTTNRGWSTLDSLRWGDYTLGIPNRGEESCRAEESQRRQLRSLSSTAGHTCDLSAGDTSNTAGPEATTYTGTCGGITTGISPLVTTSITRTKTLLTIDLTIWSALPSTSMASVTGGILRNIRRFLIPSDLSGPPGIRRKKVRSSIRRMVEKALSDYGRKQSTSLTPAPNVETLSGHEVQRYPSTVPAPARREAESGATLSRAPTAETNSPSGITEQSVAPENALLWHGVPVYDLTVEGMPEFFANGILVHNCPIPRGGGMFKPEYFNKRCRAAPRDAVRIRGWDRAATADGGCYTAGVLIAKDREGTYYVEHVVHGQWEPVERNRIMRATALRDRTRYGPAYAPRICIEREGGSSGREAWLGAARALDGFRVEEVTVTGSKDTRAEPWSTQLAAGNVFIVEDGTWDVQGYIDEHKMFRPTVGARLGKYKDQVDASSLAYNILAEMRATLSGPRVVSLGKPRGKVPRIVHMTYAELADSPIHDGTAIMVCMGDPVEGATDTVPLNGVEKLLGTHHLRFVALDPNAYQDRWATPVDGYDKSPPDLMVTREQTQKLWGFLTRRRDPVPDTYLFIDDDATRALSVVLAVADVMRHPREQSVFAPSFDGLINAGTSPPVKHTYDLIRAGRSLVI